MEKKEYYKRIERINNRFKAGRVSVDESYQLICQRNYLSTKYIKNLEQQCKKQKEVIDKLKRYINGCLEVSPIEDRNVTDDVLDKEFKYLLKILKEVSE